METKERKVVIAMDGSVHAEFAFDCKWFTLQLNKCIYFLTVYISEMCQIMQVIHLQ